MPASAATTQDADLLAEQAAHWIVRLTDDDDAERLLARDEFEAWKREDPRHAAAAASLEQFLVQMQAVRDGAGGNSRPARAALDAAVANRVRSSRSKRVGVALALAIMLVVPVGLLLHAWPPGYLRADLRTASGQWETRTLADGTTITLNSASAVNLRYDAQRRAIELIQGEILVDVAKDAARPFLVETTHGSIRALGTRFVVERHDDVTILSMIESRVSVQTTAQRLAGSNASTVVVAGRRVRITSDAVSPAEVIYVRGLSDAWQHHQLVVDDRPLAEVLDALSRHRPGFIRYDRAQIEGIRVNAVLPLDDTDRALQLLATNFPALRIRRMPPWLVMVDAPSVAPR